MILALETAAEVGGVALLQGPQLVAERTLGGDRPQHAAQLLAALDALLVEAGADLAEVELVALSIGPGSFTGLRIGLATALGLCFDTDRRIVPVPTLAALSLHAGDVRPIVPMLDARRGQVYAGIYGPGGCALGEDAVREPLAWLAELETWPGGEPIHLLGPGARLYRNEIETALGARAKLLDRSLGWPRAASVGRLGARLARSGQARRPEQVELCYLRPPEAERKRRSGHPSGKPIT